ncbi:MAG: acylneuraminate cytidylyltransferase family protein [Candidatus Puniceispirillum sp.]|nr:acylneuraminate cytidylyltransferase family protein [Candidatus Puniceispirillum sp.]
MSLPSVLPVHVVIPARKNSKRFPKKNKALLAGLPLITHSIQYALTEGIPSNQIWVNSDDPEILDIAREFGVQCYRRSDHLAEDTTSTAEVLSDQLEYFNQEGITCEAIVLLQVTNPFRPKGRLLNMVKQLLDSDRSSLFTISPLNKKFGKITDEIFEPVNYIPGQRMQDLEPLYYENGCIYVSRISLIEQAKVIGEDAIAVILDDLLFSVDIDEKHDLELAEALVRIKKEINEEKKTHMGN